MNRARLGRTDVAVTRLGFGSAPIGNLYAPMTDEQANAALEAAWIGGVRYFDTAPHYGLGLAERRLGAFLRNLPRDDYVVSTKVGRLLEPNPDPRGDDLAENGFAVPDLLRRRRDYSRDGVLRSLDESLERLGIDRIDVVYVHDPEDYLPETIRVAIPTLIELREQGVIAAIGAGMNHVAPLRRLVTEADLDVVMVAGRWTLLDRRAAALLSTCVERHVSAVVAAPFNSGLLAQHSPGADAHFDYGPASDETLLAARRFAAFAERYSTTLPQLALQFPLRHPAVAAVVAGMADARQSSHDVALLGHTVPDAVWRDLPNGIR